MALFYSEKNSKKPTQKSTKTFTIIDLDYQGLGVTKLNGKTWFVENALPSETVKAEVLEDKRHYGRAKTAEVLTASSQRLRPFCQVFEQCGGCQMQHIPLTLQRESKQKALIHRLQQLQREPIIFEPMLVGEGTHYRRRARLSIALQKNQLVMGFRKANSQQIIALSECDILEKTLSDLLPDLQQLILQWQHKKRLGHIELIHADNGIAMLLRHIGELSPTDKKQLLYFAQQKHISLFVMTDEQQINHWCGDKPFYQIDDLTLYFSIRDFIQINAALNKKMVATAVDWLELNQADNVLDLFCGMGNFTLPLAKHAGNVVGVEGVQAMIEQAKQNTEQNQLDNVTFFQTDLAQSFSQQPWAKRHFNKVLLDPARSGALFALDHLCELQPERILYISCNPATLVRDAEKLLQTGYRIQKSAIIDMFPHTGHLETMVLFSKFK